MDAQNTRWSRLAVACGVVSLSLPAAVVGLAPVAGGQANPASDYTVSVDTCVAAAGTVSISGERWMQRTTKTGNVAVYVELLDATGVPFSGDAALGLPDDVWASFTSDGAGRFSGEVPIPAQLRPGDLVTLRIFGDPSTAVAQEQAIEVDVAVGTPESCADNPAVTLGPQQATPSTQPADPQQADPLNIAEALSESTRGGLGIEVTRDAITLTIPAATGGEEFFLSTYDDAGVRSMPWGPQSVAATEKKQITVPRNDMSDAPGTRYLVVQASNGQLAGWVPYDIAGGINIPAAVAAGLGTALNNLGPALKSYLTATTTTAAPRTTTTRASTPAAATRPSTGPNADRAARSPSTPRTVVRTIRRNAPAGGAARVAAPAPATTSSPRPTAVPVAAVTPPQNQQRPRPDRVPPLPVDSAADLNSANHGDVEADIDGTVLTVTLPDNRPGDWVFVHVFSPQAQQVGWASLDSQQRISIDTARLGRGDYKFAITAENGQLVGWTALSIGATDEVAQQAATTRFGYGDLSMILGALLIAMVVGAASIVLVRRRH